MCVSKYYLLVPVPRSQQDTESKDALASRAEDNERNENDESEFDDERDNEGENDENEEPTEISEDDEDESGISDENPSEYEQAAKGLLRFQTLLKEHDLSAFNRLHLVKLALCSSKVNHAPFLTLDKR